jgi:hypothetical protein
MSSFVRVIRTILFIAGGILLLLGMLSGGAALLASFNRIQQGLGTGPQESERFGLMALVCGSLGACSLIIAKRLGRKMDRHG